MMRTGWHKNQSTFADMRVAVQALQAQHDSLVRDAAQMLTLLLWQSTTLMQQC